MRTAETLNHDWIKRHIPHQGEMCLLDHVQEWTTERIHCIASSHRHLTNPLRMYNRLGAACGIEYAAQAMAVHGALLVTDERTPQQGYLTGLREVMLFTDRLDTVVADLNIIVTRLAGDTEIILYHFTVSQSDELLLTGRATVMLDASSAQKIKMPC